VAKRAPTLLVIEDAHDQAILVGIAAQRAHPGLDVRMAHDGSDGIAYFEGSPPFEAEDARPAPDLVILDLSMPEVDGFEVLGWLKERFDPLPFPVVVLTGSDDPDDDVRARALGATDVRRKPTDLDVLGAVVREIVHEHIGRGEIIGAHIWDSG
jgi:DNA-binding response OmpR family regulator